MTREQTVVRLGALGVVAIVRMDDPGRVAEVVAAISAGGVKAIEITMTVPDAVRLIGTLSGSLPGDILLGAGTVTDAATAEAVIAAGARFVVSPIVSQPVIDACARAGIATCAGAYTPTEIFTAWRSGADIVKLFPATSLGPKYLRDLAGPFPQIRMMPTGGVSIDNVGEWIAAGAYAVGIGGDLLDHAAISASRFDVLTGRAARLVENLGAAVSARGARQA